MLGVGISNIRSNQDVYRLDCRPTGKADHEPISLLATHYPVIELTTPYPVLLTLNTKLGNNQTLSLIPSRVKSNAFQTPDFLHESCI